WTEPGRYITDTNSISWQDLPAGMRSYKVRACYESLSHCSAWSAPSDVVTIEIPYPEGLIPNGDFENGNDFLPRNANVTIGFETANPIAGTRSLKGSVNGYDNIHYSYSDFNDSNNRINQVTLTGYIKASRPMGISLRVAYENGTWADQSGEFIMTQESNGTVPLNLKVATDINRKVTLIKLVISSQCGSCTEPVEFVLDNVQLQAKANKIISISTELLSIPRVNPNNKGEAP
ncbi:MAG: hypothetical protein ACI9LM_003062, partial [Alteromonadaceae bacterium]